MKYFCNNWLDGKSIWQQVKFNLTVVVAVFALAMPWVVQADHVPSVPIFDTGGYDQIDIGNGAQDDISVTIISPHGGFGWAWDETSLNGNNSLAACTYFQDGDGEVSAVCYSVDITNGVVDDEVTAVFDCDATGYDFGTLKCAGNSATSTDYNASCELADDGDGDPNTDFGVSPFFNQAPDVDPDNDLLVNCEITNVDNSVATDLVLLNTCSKPSATESSASKDCIFTVAPGFLQLVKKIDPPEDGNVMDWLLEASLNGELKVSGNGETAVVPVEVGTYDLSEDGPEDFALDSLSCQTDDVANNALINMEKVEVTAGTLTVCTFTNKLSKANLTLVKRVINDNGGKASPINWELTAAGITADNDLINNPTGPTPCIDISDCTEASTTKTVLLADTFVLSESVVPGYTRTDLICTGGADTDVSDDLITLAPGEDVTCTFVNDDDAPSLTLIKDVKNDNGGTAVAGDWTLAAAGYDPANPTAGTFALSESGGPSGYTLTSITCDNATGPVTSATVGLGENVTCTFVNDDDAPSLTLVKKVQNNFGGTAVPGDWTLTATGYVAANPQTGTYDLSESGGPDGYTQASLTCDNASGEVTSVKLGLGDDVICTFINRDSTAFLEDGKIIVKKQTLPDGSLDSFNFLANYGNFSLTDFNDVSLMPIKEVELRPTADGGVIYNVAEASPPPGWDLTEVVCTSNVPATSIDPSAITLRPLEVVNCVFTNTQRGMVQLLKSTNGVASQTAAWDFTLQGPEVDESGSTPPATLNFNGAKLIPGETYTLCETGIPAGWTANWSKDSADIGFKFGVNNDPVDPVLGYSKIYDPNYVAPPGEYDNDTRCINFTVDPGETIAFAIDNTFPEGEQRTIGYWKNWSTCTNGNQVNTAAKNGGAAEGYFLLDDLLPITVGDLVIESCEDGVNILDKRALNGNNKNMAKDAAYRLAAQQLAAKLNLAAGAESCGVDTEVAAAQDLLESIDFLGTGNYLRPRDALYQDATEFAATLDTYNNGGLCATP